MDDRDWNVLTKIVQRGNCILMLGPEIAVKSGNKPAKPLIELFANELAKEITTGIEGLDRNNLAQMAQKFSTQEGVTDLQYLAEEFFNKHAKLRCDIHTTLATLPFHLIVTTTHDHLFIQGLTASKKKYEEEWYNFRSGRQRIDIEGSQAHPLVYSLYGNVKEPDSMVLSEHDLLDFLVAVVSQDPRIPEYLSSEFADPDKCFLFLGFGFKNWYLRILLHVLQAGNRTGRSFAMEEFVDKKDPRYKSAMIFFKDQYRIQFYHESLQEFVKELKRRFKATEKIRPATEAINGDADAPTVFICHANEDKAFAKKLYDRLRKAHLDPWLDKENIRGGDAWDSIVENTLERVDYFVVVQSKALETKIEGYVNKEIDIAIHKRQQRLRKPFRFILPIQIEDCTPLEDLKEWQTIDFSQDDKTDELISAIRRDRQRRNKL